MEKKVLKERQEPIGVEKGHAVGKDQYAGVRDQH